MQSMSSFSLSVEGRKLLQDSEESHSLAPMTEVSPDFANERFGSSLVVVIAALFFLILCVLVFNGLLCCRRLYRRWGVVSQPSLNMDVERAQTCIEKKDLEALPVTVYRTGYPLRAVDCPICLAELMEGEKVRLPHLPGRTHGRRKGESITRLLSQFPLGLHRRMAAYQCLLSFMPTLSPLCILQETLSGLPGRGKFPNGCYRKKRECCSKWCSVIPNFWGRLDSESFFISGFRQICK